MPSVPIRSMPIRSTATMVILAEDRNRHGADLTPARTQLIISSTSRASVPPPLRRLHTTLVSLGSKTLSLASHAKLSFTPLHERAPPCVACTRRRLAPPANRHSILLHFTSARAAAFASPAHDTGGLRAAAFVESKRLCFTQVEVDSNFKARGKRQPVSHVRLKPYLFFGYYTQNF